MTDTSAGAARTAEWLTVAEVAAIVRVSEQAVRNRIAAGAFPEHLVQDFDGDVRIHRSLVYPVTPSGARPASAPSPAAAPGRTGTQAGSPSGSATAADADLPADLTAQSLPIWPRTPKQLVAVIGVTALLLWFFFSDIGNNPAGFFCDEAEIALSTMEMIEDEFTSLHFPIFYEHFDYHHLGALPLYASAPILAIAPLDDWSVRLVSAVWSLLAVLMLVQTVRRLGWRHGEIAVIGFAVTPVFIHIGRIQFGHAPSLFCTASAYYCYVRARKDASWKWAIGSGLLFGAAMYGQAAWYIASPLLLGGLCLGELIVNRFNWRAYREPLVAVAAFAATCLPVLYRWATDDQFMRRFNEKDRETPPVPVMDRIGEILDHYGKYFNFDYLFRVGETGMPGGWNMRHSVPGSGELTWILLPLIIAGIIGIFRVSDATSRVVGIGALFALVLYPMPDVITTNENAPPYTFSTFSMMICVPLLSALGIYWLSTALPKRMSVRGLWPNWILPGVVLAIILIGAVQFWTGPYRNYPNVSAEYYGWQFGAGPALRAFQDNPGYDRYVLDGDFNSASVFPKFYLRDDPDLLNKTIIGWPDKSTGRLQELYAVRAERYNTMVQSNDHLRRYMRVIDVIYYPNGKICMYIVEIGTTDFWGPREIPS